MESKFVTFELIAEPRFFLHDLGIDSKDFEKNKDKNPSQEIATQFGCRLSLAKEALASDLNKLASRFELTVVSISPIEHGIQVWAKTSHWRNFRFNWRRLYQRKVIYDFCPNCSWDVSSSDESCANCGVRLTWLSGGAILT